MRHSIFFLIQKCKWFEVQILTKGQVSGDDSTKAQWKQSMAMNYDVVLGWFLLFYRDNLIMEWTWPVVVEIQVFSGVFAADYIFASLWRNKFQMDWTSYYFAFEFNPIVTKCYV